MIYPSHFEQKIGFDTIRALIREACTNPLALQFTEEMSFSADFSSISGLLKETEEIRQIILFDQGFPGHQYDDMSTELNRLRVPGTYPAVENLFNLKSSLATINECLDFFKKRGPERYPNWYGKSSEINPDPSIPKRIDLLVDDKGRIRDSASERLREIRKDLVFKRIDVDRRMEKIMRQAHKNGWTDSDTGPTIRDGRLVIPLKASDKRKVKGIVHDESSTGHTVFLEPEEIFEVNNEIRELELAERREIIRLLTEFADYLRPQIEDLLSYYVFLGYLDFVRAKARFAIKVGGIIPLFNAKPVISWFDATHPILFLSHQAQKKKVVPLNITLTPEQRILIISGPNAGGKSVVLKTIGLLQYMLQCGIPVPMRETSETGIFGDIFLDIGDEQSLENDLSTYSSHLLHMEFFIRNSGAESLFLIDEFGAGTEPQAGGAIAESILEELNARKAFGVVTTHYANLKLLATQGSGLVNGAMLFDREAMEPLFKLSIGKPGSSFAFEIARKIGLNKNILEKAAQKAGRTQLDFEEQIHHLEEEKNALDRQAKQFQMADDFLKETIDKYEKLTRDLESKKKEILDKARYEAKWLLEDTNSTIERTIREIRESQADKEKTKILRQEVEKKLQQIVEKTEESTPEQSPLKKEKLPLQDEKSKASKDKKSTVVATIDNGPVKVGDLVRLSGQSGVGTVDEIKGKEAVVTFGTIRLKCLYERLIKSSQAEAKAQDYGRPPSVYGKYIDEINAKVTDFKSTIDLRGMRAEEAMNVLRKYVDDAILVSINEIRILHGKGDGILRQLCREYIASVPEVKEYRDELLELGGHGITVVKFR